MKSKRKILLALIGSLALFACGEPIVDLNGAHLLYSGPPNVEMVDISNIVRECMKSEDMRLPIVHIVSDNFKCRTEKGWVDTWGCYDPNDDTVTLSLPFLLRTNGQSWAHELTHFYGDKSEGNDCGNVWYSGFTFH